MNQKLKILYCEDDDDIRVLAQFALTKLSNHELVFAKNGYEALQILEKQSFDLILLDVMMPEMDGLTLFNKLKKSQTRIHIPVIFITAKMSEEETHQINNIGAKGVILKPFNPNLLEKTIFKILEENL
jgi:CheY-like chemotaxis protein